MNDVMKLLPHSTKDAKVTPWPINPHMKEGRPSGPQLSQTCGRRRDFPNPKPQTPHPKPLTLSQMESKDRPSVINEICELRGCNAALYFEVTPYTLN